MNKTNLAAYQDSRQATAVPLVMTIEVENIDPRVQSITGVNTSI